MQEIIPFVLGPVATNAYLVGEPESRTAAVIDPAWDGELIAEEASQRGWHIQQLWLTHAHFDHIGGIAGILRRVQPAPQIALHPADLTLYSLQGEAAFFGLHIEAGPEPTIRLDTQQKLTLGESSFEVLHCPGHTPGHVIFYCADEQLAFCGDVIFEGGIGRTDLPGGDYETLIHSIQTNILTLPDDTRLLSGHGGETTVVRERLTNPFIN